VLLFAGLILPEIGGVWNGAFWLRAACDGDNMQACKAVGIKFYINNCAFPAEGLFWVELMLPGAVVARQARSLTS
jgi:hypothetical protein